eukprot:CAMPEP_0171907830 /NCGR_PEP_ID=MMETSP0993-20121228/7310_1 /TAXON_ID=483369 /ORGANISM="non described non described, Strain CCMP2098" /LENGTH=353 /DNA_ID=CAMNT_0012540207 /DNA_START=70 /DNA_END=1131 /DNA_ORIENTATION=-
MAQFGVYLLLLAEATILMAGGVATAFLHAPTPIRRTTRFVATRASASPCLSPVVICPAQFGTKEDYADLVEALLAAGHPAVAVAPLSRLSWLRIVPSAFTEAYWKSELELSPALDFYIEAIDKAVAEVQAACGPDTPVTIVGHSIGGWVARGYLSERPSVLDRVDVVATLGSPNRTPPEGTLWAKVDQTRGLLRSVNAKWQLLGKEKRPAKTVCVIGKGTSAAIPLFSAWDEEQRRSPLLEGLVALVSYLALSGDGFGTQGDGLIPCAAAVVDLNDGGGEEEVVVLELEGCNHAGFVPTPGASLLLPDTYEWYGSPSMLPQWLPFLATGATQATASATPLSSAEGILEEALPV